LGQPARARDPIRTAAAKSTYVFERNRIRVLLSQPEPKTILDPRYGWPRI
jgi:hypothetical protein